MIDWQKTASHVIDEVHRNLPADADLAARKKALRAARPWEFASTSWGKKVWAKHSRKYLEKFGLPPLKPKAVEDHLLPLERLIAKAKGDETSPAASTNKQLDALQRTRKLTGRA
ncbi:MULTISPECIES: hypothetical protein [Sinorhizobium]|uniref:hypothetical protein n=1 Tax=Sinorhizobium TaxID=28105 RepID=UPI001F48A664|nr:MULTISPECIES: hypothetical protein [Sinorhizobium]